MTCRPPSSRSARCRRWSPTSTSRSTTSSSTSPAGAPASSSSTTSATRHTRARRGRAGPAAPHGAHPHPPRPGRGVPAARRRPRAARAGAAQLGCELGAIANSLVFDADGAPLLVMTSGAHRVDVAKVARLTGAAEVRRAQARSVREWTGQVIGGVAPVGHPSPIRTLVDEWLDKYEVVWAAGRHPHTVFPTSLAQLIRITDRTPADVGA